MTDFPSAKFIPLEKSAGVSPNSWVALQHDRDSSGNIKKYRFLSVVENAECYYFENSENVTVKFKKGSLLTLDVVEKSYNLSYFQDSVNSLSNDTNDTQTLITDYKD